MSQSRFKLFLISFGLFNLVLLGRFFYWQFIKGEQLSAIATRQRLDVKETHAPRGIIYTQDNYPLVINKTTYNLNIYQPNLKVSKKEFSSKIGQVLAESEDEEVIEATGSAILNKLSSNRNWLNLSQKLTKEKKKVIEEMELGGVEFIQNEIRNYPEASMAAHLIGFVGSDQDGNPQGYFGLEGNYHQQLSGQPGLLIRENNPFGQTILSGERIEEKMRPGLNLTLYLERPVQFIVEEELKKGLEKYQAKSGWAVVIDPQTGAILGMASQPKYDPANFSEFEEGLYPNPIIAEGFEPGSIFKPLIMAAAIEENVVKPDTECLECDGPLRIGEYTIKTWNEEYHPTSTMTEVIVNSDNVGMAWVGQKLGRDKLINYLNEYGFGQKTSIDLQEEAQLSVRSAKDWYPIDVATASFGQGVLVTPIQLTRAFASLANQGKLVKPRVVDQIWTANKLIFDSQTEVFNKPLSPQTTEKIKEMLIEAVEQGSAKWTKLENLVVAGKTGTAQIPIAGHYDEEKTIASFIGFAPANKPKFVMLVSLSQPQTSPWGSETAAPLWFNIAEKLSYYWSL